MGAFIRTSTRLAFGILVLTFCTGISFRYYSTGDATKVADAFLAAAKAGDETALASHLTSELSTAESRSKVAGFVRQFKLDHYRKVRWSGHLAETKNGDTAAVLIGLVSLDDNDVLPIKFILVRRADAWKIASITMLGVESPEAMQWLHKTAEKGFADAQWKLGSLYLIGTGVERNYATAYNWLIKAAEQGYANAQLNIGTMYYDGLGRKKDFAVALGWYKKAAEQEQPAAQYLLARMYRHGQGVERDMAKAVKWYEKAASHNDGEALVDLAYLYHKGLGVAEDEAKAFSLSRKAAELGEKRGQFLLGRFYETGKGVPQDRSKAVDWYRKAAEQGFAAAQCNLGYQYMNGHGVARDDIRAYKWMKLGVVGLPADQTRDRIEKDISQLEKRMSPEDLHQAKHMIAEWKQK